MSNRYVCVKLPFEAELISPSPALSDDNCKTRPSAGSSPTLVNGKARRIWIDIDNSPHVPFFLPIIEELEKRGFEVGLTARDTYQVCELLDFFGLSCDVIGRHYGTSKVFKVLGNCLRASQLVPTAVRLRPHLALSHGSRAQILVCKALGIPTIMMHDYEHSTKTGFIEPDWTFIPEVIPDRAMSRGVERTLKYPGLKEDVYVPRFRPNPTILTTLGIARDEFVVTLRPPATEAHYHNPESEQLFAEALRFLAENRKLRAVVLPRSARQGAELRRDWADLIAAGSMIMPSAPVDGLNLIWFSDLVISGGGTMNREAAALGVPVYSIFRGKIGAVDKYLARNGRLTLLEEVKDIRAKIKIVRRERSAKPENCDRLALTNIIDNIVSVLEDKCLATSAHA